MAQIVGVGHCCYDYLCTVEDYPAEDTSTHILSIANQGGGAVGTALVAAARQGISTQMIACIGDDEAGQWIRQGFVAENVGLHYAQTVPGGRSSVSYVMVDPQKGTRTKFPYRDDLPEIEWTKERRDAIREASVLHLDGTRYENALAAARLAKEYGTLVSLDGCSMQQDNEKNRSLASLADILIMNARYPFRVAQTEDIETALRYFGSLGPKVVITTAGGTGCKALLDGKVVSFPAYPVEAIDTTGAGDVFHGAFLGLKLRHSESRVYTLTGDGELDEGIVWEAASAAAQYSLDNLTLIVDRNRLQLDGCTEDVMALRDLKAKFTDFGFVVDVIDGHDYDAIFEALGHTEQGKPHCIIANTIKGRGVSYMENNPDWHGKVPGKEELALALRELEVTSHE